MVVKLVIGLSLDNRKICHFVNEIPNEINVQGDPIHSIVLTVHLLFFTFYFYSQYYLF